MTGGQTKAGAVRGRYYGYGGYGYEPMFLLTSNVLRLVVEHVTDIHCYRLPRN